MTTLPSTDVRQARPDDTPVVSAILFEATAWLEQRGTPMWRDNELQAERVQEDVAAGLFFLATVAGEPVGTLRFQLSDPLFWPEAAQDAAYVHRLAIRRRFAGGEVSSLLLGWAVQRAAALGRRFLRLDCDAARPRLRAVYERFWFRHHSDRQVGPYFVARYEFPLQVSDFRLNPTRVRLTFFARVVQIELLADRPEFLPTLAEWHHAQWAYLRPGDTVEARIARLAAACQHRHVLPLVFIAIADEHLLGSAMLLPRDMDTRPELSPWLGGVFTAPEARGNGVGSALSQHVMQRAAELGFSRLYLYTPDAEGFYARLGWVTLKRTRYKDTAVTVMCHPLPARPPCME